MSGHILLVDDEPSLRESVQAYLEDSGFVVQVASNAREAWQLLEQTTPDLVISDIMMPQVSGYDFLKQMREDVRFLNLPVVLLTAKGMTKDRIEGYTAGCDAYLPKPFDPDELVAIAENLIARRAMQSVTANSNTSEITDLAGQLAEIKALLKQKPAINVTPPPIKIEFTPREQSVLELVVEGLMNKEIAKRLGTTIRNVEKYVSRLFSKTGTSSRTELVRYALQHGLIDSY
ncbi:response regulator transcription factor [Pseudanabaena sp. FACHB-1277]|jgi:DNA-binding NarL/FixJ family response regulator|uniref:Response regulator transcription factor n=1 Tax=Pseudanabaena cinerea FACHB-1277 TaxID=2949581 RepID=A0A926UV39_9CYAN|nr:response regulator transcription factor [Pseudanabaena cinerea]MBD2151935.1 response regulator transcription factor [Pseudanabaena cinerea FACHB-1277]